MSSSNLVNITKKRVLRQVSCEISHWFNLFLIDQLKGVHSLCLLSISYKMGQVERVRDVQNTKKSKNLIGPENVNIDSNSLCVFNVMRNLKGRFQVQWFNDTSYECTTKKINIYLYISTIGKGKQQGETEFPCKNCSPKIRYLANSVQKQMFHHQSFLTTTQRYAFCCSLLLGC